MAYQIKQVSDILGIPKNTLIAWERRYGIVDPDRTESGYRMYSDADVATLREVQRLLDQGYKVGEACRIILHRDAPRNGVAHTPRPEGNLPSDRAALVDLRDQLKTHLLAFDRPAADRVATRLLMVPFEQAMDDVYFPLMREIGAGWEAGRITVVQEHFVTAYCREKLLVMLHSVQSAADRSGEVTCATPPGEHHELGLLGLALRLALRGWRVVYLGANVPTGDLVRHVVSRKPAALCLSLVHGRPRGEVLDYARELRSQIPDTIRIAMGGRATVDIDEGAVEGVDFTGHGLPSWLEG